MKLKEIISILLLFFFICNTSGMPCTVNSVCYQHRGQIVQDEETVTLTEKIYNKGRAWYIRPTKTPTNALLAFKNFTSTSQSVVMVITYHSEQEKTSQYFYGDLGNFEVLCKNAIGIIIYVPIQTQKVADFLLDYYTGCKVLTGRQDQIKYPSSVNTTGQADDSTQCWFIQTTEGRSQRIYFSIRNAAIAEGQELQVKDIHSSQVIGKVQGRKLHQMFASESNTTQSILVEVNSKQHSNNQTRSRFFLSYYAMTKEDATCIDRRKECGLLLAKIPTFPSQLCNIACPAFDEMMVEEYEMEASKPQIRTGTTNEAAGSEVEGRSLYTPQNVRCPIANKALCVCPSHTNPYKFCKPNINCFREGGCTFSCIVAQFTVCIRHVFMRSLELL